MRADTAPKNALSLFSTLLSTLFFSPLSHPRLAFLVPVPGLEEGFIKSPGIPARPSCTEGKLSLSKRRFGFAFASAARRGAAGPALPRTPMGRGQMGVRGGFRLIGRRTVRGQPHQGSGCGLVLFPVGSTPPGLGWAPGWAPKAAGIGRSR